jgi:hypothetical protein
MRALQHFFLPASQNSLEVLGHAGKGRRSFEFNLIFEDPNDGRKISSIATVVAGSDSVNGSLLRIEPGREVLVLFTGDLRPITAWFREGLVKVKIRAGGSETTFADSNYFVERKSEQILSANAHTIDLK